MTLNRTTFNRIGSLMMGTGALVLVLMIVLYPDQAFDSSLKGLSIWWNVVFPALLPFFMLSEFMRAYGLMQGLGVLLEPLMRVLFRIPGVGGWALALGMTAGSPAGAEATAALRRNGLVSRGEGERLLSLSHMSGPVFIVIVVGTGFLGQPKLGVILAVVHLVSALAAGALLALFSGRPAPTAGPAAGPPYRSASSGIPLFRRVLLAVEAARTQDGRGFGKVLGDSVYQSVQTLLVIGGYIIMFSLFLKVAFLTYTAFIVQMAFIHLLEPFGITQQAAHQLISALFEVHLGAHALSQPSGVGPFAVTLLIACGLAWSGLCLHAQVRSIIKDTDLRYGTFLLGRLVHIAVSLPVAIVLWQPLQRLIGPNETAAFMPLGPRVPAVDPAGLPMEGFALAVSTAALLGICIGGMLAVSLAASLLRRLAKFAA
ncbi:nucleoside recognition domain-containing protein [Paenibacillus turpanensis]|uniref:nucleoside recognition domain-containing protein n=1 Tax=Paenibacillus turpanensis TaxID=2689078 RepID=UPI0014097080|nr:nucleoside recognition domain-containing protein [Paenibacillus turpanensis]